jgi:hypothetical protein
VIEGAKFCAQCGYTLAPAMGSAARPVVPAPPGRNTMQIALWTAGILVLVLIGGIGSCVYVVGRGVHRKFEQAKQAIEEARPAGGGGLARVANLDACTLITQEELTEIYKRPFAAPVKDGTSCRFGGVRITVAPDFFLFLRATQQYEAHPHILYEAHSFYADGTLFLSYHSLFVKIQPLHGRTDAEEIAKLVLARL